MTNLNLDGLIEYVLIQRNTILRLNPLNPISVKNSKYDRLFCPIILDIVVLEPKLENEQKVK